MGKTKTVKRQVRKPKRMTPWLGLPKNFNPSEFEGFVYLITCLKTNKKYIGRKYFWKGRPRKKARKESDWQYYKSSSLDLIRDIELSGIESFRFEILTVCKTRAETNYTEIREQFIRDVLYSLLPSGEYEYYNGCVLNRYYRRTK